MLFTQVYTFFFLVIEAALNVFFAATVPSDKQKASASAVRPVSVNFHFTRKCNYECGFCFHTGKTDTNVLLEDAMRGMELLKEAGMRKINFSGGEPFIVDRGNYVGQLVKYCKQDLGIESVTIVSNGSLIRKAWFKNYGEYLDILAISCDSFNEETNRKIGRAWRDSKVGQGKSHIRNLESVRDWCREYGVKFKINSVINAFNHHEDMSERIRDLAPCRWKVFQCLLVDGENAGAEKLRNAEPFCISDEEFQNFVMRHSSCTPAPTVEDNSTMRSSYLILDEQMRFLDCSGGAKVPGPSLLEVGVEAAMRSCHFDNEAFVRRDGIYDWSRSSCPPDKDLEW